MILRIGGEGHFDRVGPQEFVGWLLFWSKKLRKGLASYVMVFQR